ncbi:MAG: hypothetical protein M5U34_18805 [Chloroflexi bacterium]|nr:hypothetical protein [Chloroflexota bacterium]
MPAQVAVDFERFLGLQENMEYMQRQGALTLHPLAEGQSVTLGNYTVTPFPVAEAYVYAFLFEGEGQRVLIAPDELVGWQPPDFVQGVDLVILPMGIVEFDVWTGERRIPADHPVFANRSHLPPDVGHAATDAAQAGHHDPPGRAGQPGLRRLCAPGGEDAGGGVSAAFCL